MTRSGFGRPRTFGPRPPRTRPLLDPRNQSNDVSSEPPLKKRKYIPGGPGGGGRYIYVDGTEAPAPPRSTTNRPKSTVTRARTNRGISAISTPSRQPAADLPILPPPQQQQQQQKPLPLPLPLRRATPPSTRPRREKNQNRRYSSAAAAALAATQGDCYKPREEKGWEEFHPNLDIDAKLAVFTSQEVDGIVKIDLTQDGMNDNDVGNGVRSIDATSEGTPNNNSIAQPVKRRPGRPRLSETTNRMLDGIGSPSTPKVVPPPGPNPREKLTLPKPSYALKDPFLPFEQKGVGQQNYVDRTMASVGYQESDIFIRHEGRLVRMSEGAAEDDLDLEPSQVVDGDGNPAIGTTGVGRVEYDMDEQDERWLEAYNVHRRAEQFEPIKPAIFEITMTKIEKEWHALEKRIPKPNPKPPQTQRPRSSSAAAVNGEHSAPGEEQDSKCAVCDDGDCENANAIVFCDGCDLAVHQECYGVPYIPEGQWLCRKCQLVGRGSLSCIFCPNTEGAFKQTNTSKWAHLVCSIWIPEVSIGNPALMEPVNEVEKVPRNRWKLLCYICRQRMGACIQCSNKNCFLAYHVTCARKAHLYLKMKLTPGAPAVMDSNNLKSFCDKHVPPDWRREHNTDEVFTDAVEFYRNTMQGRNWGDSQAAALALETFSQETSDHQVQESRQPVTPHLTLTVGGGNKRKRQPIPKTIWKLPSGAPVIPQIILNSVVASLQRFTVRQRKQYAEDACKYWTLKREARRGAALLKRLQLQMETFSSMEMTRRDFVAMGAAGPVRLRRRIEFADRLHVDLDKVRMLCDEVKKREKEKLKDAETLRTIIDMVYFPISPMLWPIFEKVQGLDSKGVFINGLHSIKSKLEDRSYASVSAFSRDLANVFTSEIGVESVEDTAELQLNISGRAPELSLDQREKRTLAKRIVKAVQPALEQALKSESELLGKPFEKELRDLDLILDSSVMSRRGSQDATDTGLHNSFQSRGDSDNQRLLTDAMSVDNDSRGRNSANLPTTLHDPVQLPALQGGVSERSKEYGVPVEGKHASLPAVADGFSLPDEIGVNHGGVGSPQTIHDMGFERESTTITESNPKMGGNIGVPKSTVGPVAPPTPPISSSEGQETSRSGQGGVPWYMQPFDPIGTTIYEERWTGRDVLRSMSEDLSEIDEQDLQDLAEDRELTPMPNKIVAAGNTGRMREVQTKASSKIKSRKTRRRWR